MNTMLSAIIALMVLIGVAGSASAFDCDDDRASVDETFSTGEGR
jgi:hypothetical protein